MAKSSNPAVKLGALNHIGLVVEDVDEAVEFYESMFGIGPFTVDTYQLKGVMYRGKPMDAVIKAGFGFSGDCLIELVEVVEGETPHTEFFRARGEGVQHIAFPVDDMRDALDKLAERGIEPLFEYKFIAHDAPVSDPDPAKRRPLEVWEAYLDTGERTGGTVIQLMEVKEISEESASLYVANPAS
jgi:methylmalonyl-CoA/ethylmalonyl-CoA epimerase